MGGTVIAFPGGRASTHRSAGRKSLPRGQRRRLKMHIERITALLEELEDISRHSSKLPPAVRARTRTSIRKAERMLGVREDVAHAASPILEQEGDPQPHVEREVLERLFNCQDQFQ